VSTVDRQPITDWFMRLLEAGTGRPVVRADEVPSSPDYPFSVVHPIEGGSFSGSPLYAPDADADFVYQVDAVGVRQDSAEWLADTTRRTVLARHDHRHQVNVELPQGYRIASREPYVGPGGPIAGESSTDGKQASVVSWPERYLIRVVGA
jgi:hypothetical protein